MFLDTRPGVGWTITSRTSSASSAGAGRDPRSLGENCSAYELELSRAEVKALQQVAFDQLASAGPIAAAPLVLARPVNPERCIEAH